MAAFSAKTEDSDFFRPRIFLAGILMLLGLLILAAKLWSLQLIHGPTWDEMSRNNRQKFVRLAPQRGRILDVSGRVLAENHPSFTFSVIPGELENVNDLIQVCSPILGMPQEKIRSLIARSRSDLKFVSFPIKKNMSLEEVSLIKTALGGAKGASVETRALRTYPYKETLCHVLGVLGEVSSDELEKISRLGYRSGDYIGKSGIEKEYEEYLKGDEGWEQVEIDAKGRRLSNFTRKPPKTGADIYLSVDAEFQRFIDEIFIHRAGSVVAVDPDTGRILALVSKPGYDNNLFTPSISEKEWKRLNTDALHPLENRAIRGLYPPGSTFKIVTAAAGLSEKVVGPDRKFTCKGQLELSGQVFRCWNHYGHGSVALHRALVESCDVYFYELGLKLGADRIAKYASVFGMGSPSGLIGLADELPGLVPTSSWKLRTYGDGFKDGETVTVSIGQGYLSCTPIQLAMMTAAMANGGKLMRPTLIRQITAHDGSRIYDHERIVRWDIPVDHHLLDMIQSALVDVVADPKGTGRKCRIPGISIKAKTGTSQVIRVRQRVVEEDLVPYHERTHAMFVAYVNDRPKKIALVVIVEHGGGGGASAAPLARKIIARYYGVPDPGDPVEKPAPAD